MIDGHIHYIEYMGADRLNQIVEEYHYDGIALQCIPDNAGREVLGDAFRYREQCPVPVYIFGGIRRELYRLPEDELRTALVWEARNLMTKGCTGIKMLEGKPNIRKYYPIPDFDQSVWEDYWAYLEQEQIPVYMHVCNSLGLWFFLLSEAVIQVTKDRHVFRFWICKVLLIHQWKTTVDY